jgi:hypothetical protein
MDTTTFHVRSKMARSGGLLVLLLQLGLGVFVPLAHAHSGLPLAGVHVEAPGNESCPAADTHGPCQVCRTLQSPLAIGEARPELVARFDVSRSPRLPDTSTILAFELSRAHGARAPPLA